MLLYSESTSEMPQDPQIPPEPLPELSMAVASTLQSWTPTLVTDNYFVPLWKKLLFYSWAVLGVVTPKSNLSLM